jgi:hypothetical protein
LVEEAEKEIAKVDHLEFMHIGGTKIIIKTSIGVGIK